MRRAAAGAQGPSGFAGVAAWGQNGVQFWVGFLRFGALKCVVAFLCVFVYFCLVLERGGLCLGTASGGGMAFLSVSNV